MALLTIDPEMGEPICLNIGPSASSIVGSYIIVTVFDVLCGVDALSVAVNVILFEPDTRPDTVAVKMSPVSLTTGIDVVPILQNNGINP